MTPHEAFIDAASRQFTLAKAIYSFHHRHQDSEEYVDDFLTALHTLITDCDFRNQSDQNLMLQLIEGCGDRKVQLELLATRDLTLEGTLAIMRAHETTLRVLSHGTGTLLCFQSTTGPTSGSTP